MRIYRHSDSSCSSWSLLNSISSAVFASRLASNLASIQPPLPAEVAAAVRDSVSVVFTLPDVYKDPVMDAYTRAVDDVFLIIVGGAAFCSLSALLISRGRVNVKLGM